MTSKLLPSAKDRSFKKEKLLNSAVNLCLKKKNTEGSLHQYQQSIDKDTIPRPHSMPTESESAGVSSEH